MSQLWSPYNIYDEVLLWLDATDPNANDGDGVPVQDKPVYRWVDKSQSGYIFEQNTQADMPIYDLANKAIKFDGTEHMSCAGIDNWPASFHMFIVASITITDDGDTNVLISGDSASGTQDWSFVQEATGSPPATVNSRFTYKNGSGGDEVADSLQTTGTNTVGLFEVLAGTTNYVDLDNSGRIGINTEDISIDNDVTVNLMKNLAGDETTGSIHEIIVLDALASRGKRWAVQGYLQDKYDTDILLPGRDSSGATAVAVHPYKNNPPKTGDVLEINVTTGETEQLSNIFQDAHKIAPRRPIQYVRMSLDFCDNVFGSNVFPSTCTADSTAEPCFNTRTTCVDKDNYRIDSSGKRQYYFTQEVGDRLDGFEGQAHPCLMSVTSAPTEIVPTKGISLRSNVTIKLRDFMSVDSDQDDYTASRSTIATDRGTYFERLVARNQHYLGRTIEVFDGYIDFQGNIQSQDGKRKYIIDSLFLDNDVLTIKCKDPLTLSDELKSKVPEPTHFSLAASISGGSTPNHVALKYDGVAINPSDSDDVAKVTDYFGANDAIGFVRINDEICKYQVHIDVGGQQQHAAIDITDRDLWGTNHDNTAHEIDDAVQKCIAFGDEPEESTPTDLGSTINEVAYEILVNNAGVPASAINSTAGGLYSWADENTVWLNIFKIRTIFSEPKEANKIISQLGTMVGVNFFYDDMSGQIVMRAETPEPDSSKIVTITDDHILEDSLKFVNSEKERVSRVYYYYGQRNFIDDIDKPKSYRKLYVNVDSDSEGAEEYGVEANKTIFAYGVNDDTGAKAITQRLLNRFKSTPKTVTFELDVSFDTIRTGDHFFLQTRHITDFYGAPRLTEMQVLSTQLDSKKQTHKIKAKQFSFAATVAATITAPVATIGSGGSNYAVGESLTFTGGSGSGFTCDVSKVDGSGAVTEITPTAFGTGYTVGNTLSYNTGSTSGSGLTFTVTRETFIGEGSGTGSDTDPYQGARASESYISADDDKTVDTAGNRLGRPFITASILDGGSGWSGTTAVSGDDLATGNGSGLTLDVIRTSGGSGACESVTVTSNPSTATTLTDGGAIGYFDGQEIEIDDADGSGEGLTIVIRVRSRMSDGSEPYKVI